MEGAPKRTKSESIPIDSEFDFKPEQRLELHETLERVGAMSRRSFLTGAAVTVAAAALPKEAKAFEVPVEYSDSIYFDAAVAEIEPVFEKDIAFIVEHGAETINGRTIFECLSEDLTIDGVSDTVLSEMKKYVIAMAMNESRMDGARVSGEGAKGFLGIMENEWETFSVEGMDPLSPSDQAIVVGRLLSQKHRYLQNKCWESFEKIRQVFFEGDEERFDREFLVPTLINAHHSGEGNLAKLVNGFAAAYNTVEDTAFEMDRTEAVTGRDVFLLMSHNGFHQKLTSSYGKHSTDYVFQVCAAWNVFDRTLTEEQKVMLLGKLTS